MKKTYALDELDCANCGLKMEDAIRKIDGVKSVICRSLIWMVEWIIRINFRWFSYVI